MTTTKVQNGEIMYADLFLDKLEADILFEDFITSLPFQQGTIKLFGKTHSIPRLEAFFASEKRIYSYSGVDLQTHDFTKELLVLKGKIEKYLKVKNLLKSAQIKLFLDQLVRSFFLHY